MKKEEYEKQIQELNEQAMALEKTMSTYSQLEIAKRDGHDLHAIIESSQFGEINAIEIHCNISGAVFRIERKTPMYLEVPSNPELFGDLAGKKLKDIEVATLPPKTSEPADKPTVPLENVEQERLPNQQGSGSYKVDIGNFLG